MKRVLHFTPGFRLGGVETLLLGLYRNLDRDRFQFDFVTDNVDSMEEFEEIRSMGGRVHQMGRYVEDPLGYQRKFGAVLDGMDPRMTIFHAHDPIRGLPLLVSARRRGLADRVLHSHTDSFLGARRRHIAPFAMPLASGLATKHFACSRAAGEFMFGKRDFVVLRNAIDLTKFAFNADKREALRSQLAINPDATVIGHTGRFTFQKNHRWVIEVFAQFAQTRPRARLLLVGAGPLEPEMVELVARFGLTDAVIFAGKQRDVDAYLSAMDLFLMPSHFEGLGISLLEAQASGLPSLVSDVFAPEVLVTQAVQTMSLKRSASEWADALLKKENLGRYASSDQIDRLRDCGYDVREEAKRLMKLYSEQT